MTTEMLIAKYSKQSYIFPLGLIGGLLAWLVMIVVLVFGGAFVLDGEGSPFPMLMAVLGPPLVLLFAYRALTPVRNWVHTIDIRLLILPHTLRMVGMGFIFLYFYDRLPALFAFPAGLGDALAAIAAMYLIGRYLLDRPVTKTEIQRWNLYAFLDFVVAVSMGILTRSNGLLQFDGHPASDPMGLFPLALIPGYFVPLYVCTHIMIWLKLRKQK